jgi:hypothetical protein
VKRLKTPNLKMPAAVSDVYYDLHDRRLLPLLALVVVAIAAVPFLLGGDAEEAAIPPPAESPLAQASGAGQIDPASLTVVEAKPGLRDYRKRLAQRTPTNPFTQKYTDPVARGAQLQEPSGSGESTEPASSEGAPEASPGVESGGGKSGGAPPSSGDGDGEPSSGRPKLVFYSYAINVRITKSGGKDAGGKKPEPVVKKRVLAQTAIPGDKTPVVTFLGAGSKGEKTRKATGKALFLVSDNVKSVFGETRCVSGKDVCQLIEVEPGFPVTFVYGANEVRYTINVLKFGLVVTGHSKLERSETSRFQPWSSQSFNK